MQRTARTSRCYSGSSGRVNLDKVYAAVGDVLAGEKPARWTLKAFKYDYVVWDKAGVTVILIEPTDQLIQFQQKLIDAVAPFTVNEEQTEKSQVAPVKAVQHCSLRGPIYAQVAAGFPCRRVQPEGPKGFWFADPLGAFCRTCRSSKPDFHGLAG